MKNQSIHATLLALVGGYILYLAYQIFDALRLGKDEMPFALAVAAVVFFVLAGLGVLFYAWKVWQASRREEKEEDENDLK